MPTAVTGPPLSSFPPGSFQVAGMMVGYQLVWRSVVPIIAATASGGLLSDERGRKWKDLALLVSPMPLPQIPRKSPGPRVGPLKQMQGQQPTSEPCLWSGQETLPSLKVGVASRKSSCEELTGVLVSDTTCRAREEHSSTHSPGLGGQLPSCPGSLPRWVLSEERPAG